MCAFVVGVSEVQPKARTQRVAQKPGDESMVQVPSTSQPSKSQRTFVKRQPALESPLPST